MQLQDLGSSIPSSVSLSCAAFATAREIFRQLRFGDLQKDCACMRLMPMSCLLMEAEPRAYGSLPAGLAYANSYPG
jgi:hypothetical protein